MPSSSFDVVSIVLNKVALCECMIARVALKMRKVSIGHTEFQYAAKREKQTTYGISRDGVCDAVSSRDGVCDHDGVE
ncbi:hypothetical protein DD238_008338 [Peronospora effusa]|uniref:Uncharacterized protein n=1 Tax=Peronospora effusa TaxID=542832 RepID=A0A3M6V749_9STRA|nr:hypothetical protein DD238_008338 [Peronospora effusa]RQM11139.1 hypothetical protein DD237_008376 [Peronospora effusa]